MSTIGDDLLRESGETLPDGRAFGPRIEALVVYNSNPVAVAPDSRQVAAGFRARRPVHRRARALPHRHRRPRRLRAARHHAAGALGRARQLRPHLPRHQRAGADAARAVALQRGDLPRAGAAHGLHRSLLRRRRRGAGARRPSTGPVPFEQLRELGWAKLPLPEAPFADGGFPTPDGRAQCDVARPRPARLRAAVRERAQRARARAPLPAGDDLAAGAQLPQLHLRQRQEPARHRAGAGARDRSRPTPPRAASPTATRCACSTTAATTAASRA